MPAELGIEVVDDGPPAVLVVRGEIDIATSPRLDDVVANLSAGELVIDLSGVTFMGSSGLASLLRASQQAAELGGSLVLRSPSRQVRDLFEMTHLLDHFTIEET